MVDTRTLVEYLHGLLEADAVRDYSPNGLQVEGAPEVRRLLTGVTACQALLDTAVQWGADAILVHHGWFWKNEPPQLTDMKRRRVASVLDAGINLLAYHLPLDVHRGYGNNAELGRRLGVTVTGQVDAGGVPGLLWHGRLDEPVDGAAFARRIGEQLQREPLHVEAQPAVGSDAVAWCTGAGQDFIEQAADLGVDAFVTGEVSERTHPLGRASAGCVLHAAGHHATERYGVQALGAHVAERFDLEHRFVDVDNPA
ncbi:MAG: Nif3-like dinuclear metal center hexameric protein [Halofilum sp. (in: g-proteobacteria)]|nr:Nif3-like dinuclear metal center hexameric protein [Halofilum sp. (in: g-proteobacteria)]